MTSQKSLKNNVNTMDFKRSLSGTLLFPIIAFVVLLIATTFPVIDYVTDKEFIRTPVHFEIQMFIPYTSIFCNSPELLFAGMVFCGAFIAMKSYFFLLSKKQVNVFLSLGVTRKTMFINRTASAIITLFVSTFIPVFITYLINIAKFGASGHLTSVFLYFFTSLFVSGLVGYAIVAFAMMVSGNLFEVCLVGASLSFIPIMVYNCYDMIQGTFLKGYMYNGKDTNWTSVLIPFFFVNNTEQRVSGEMYFSVNDILSTVSKDMLVKGEIPEQMLIDKYFIIPVVAWAIVAVALIFVAGLLLNRRKAEHANSFGHFAVSRAVVAIFVFTLATYLAIGLFGFDFEFDFEIIATFIFTAIITLVGFFLTQLIMSRKTKTFVKSLPVYAVALGVTAVMFLMIGTEYFGTYNKTPEKEDIKNVAINFGELDLFYNSVYPSNQYIKSTDSSDIDMVIEIFDIVKKDSKKNGKWEGEILFAFEDKEGNIKYRSFPVYSAEIYMTYLEKTHSSPYFDAVVEETLLGFNEKNISANGKYLINENTSMYDYMIHYEDSDDVAFVNYFDNTMIVKVGDVIADEENGKTGFSVVKGNDLARALYEDYTKMTFDELFKNPQKPVAVLGCIGGECFNANDNLKPSVDESDKYMYLEETYFYGEGYPDKVVQTEETVCHSLGTVFIYPQMTKTIQYFTENQRDFEYQYVGKIKGIYYSDLSFNDAAARFADLHKNRFPLYGDAFSDGGEIRFFRNNQFSNSDFRYLMDYITEDTNYMTLFEDVFNTAESPLKPIDKSKHQSVIDNTVPYYLTYKDQGKYIYFVYEDGTITCQYLPEAKLSVLK